MNDQPKWNYVGYTFAKTEDEKKFATAIFLEMGIPERQIFFEEYRNSNGSRSVFDRCMKHLRKGDVFHVIKPSDLARTIEGVLIISKGLTLRRDIFVCILSDDPVQAVTIPEEFLALDFFPLSRASTPKRHRDIKQDTVNNIGPGRPPTMSVHDWEVGCIMALQGATGGMISNALSHVSRATVYRYLRLLRQDAPYPFRGFTSHKPEMNDSDWSFF